MANGQRPGGLTALAVLNFVFGGIATIVTLFAFLAIGAASHVGSAMERGGATVTNHGPSAAVLYINVLLMAVSAALLIVSGVGYIKQKRFTGRTLGTVYAVLSLGSTAMTILLIGGGIGIGTILLSIYPVLTLIMVNTTFKDDLVN
jgi:hypothetical protein